MGATSTEKHIMKSLTHFLTVLALSTAFATAADEAAAPAAGKKKNADPEMAYKKIDADSNGSVTLEEFKNSPRGKKDPSKAEQIFKRKDANGDGALSLDEFKARGQKGEKKKKNA